MIDYNEDSSWKQRKSNPIALVFFACVVLGVVLAGHSCATKEKIKLQKCHSGIKPSIREIKMAEYFRINGNKHPKLMAHAVLQTHKPKIMASIAVKGEKNSPYTSLSGGYKKRHVGAWQVNEQLHGFAGREPVQQALKAEAVLDDILKECKGDLRKALNIYGGDKTEKIYAENILAEIQRVP